MSYSVLVLSWEPMKREKQVGEGMSSAYWVVALSPVTVKLLYDHSRLHCPQNSFMLS